MKTVESFLRDHLSEIICKLPADDYTTLKAWHHKAADLLEAQQREIEVLRVDAERYRKLRRKAIFKWRNGPGLYWYLPRGGERGLTDGDRLDMSLDAEP